MDVTIGRPAVLVVDDENSGAEALCILLEQAGYSTRVASNGPDALACAASSPPDLVLLDVMMPQMDGFETCERLHRLPGLADLPGIFLTGSTERSSVAKAFNTGAMDYLTKPFVLEELLARVKTHVELKRSRDRLGQMLREREEITNVVAHDLKNPLTCVLFAVEALNRSGHNEARRAELSSEIVECTRFALDFIQRFLARGAEGQRLRQFSARQVDLLEIVKQAIRVQRTAAEISEVTLHVSGEPTTINADPDVTRNVLQNLLSNAIQYSPAGSTVDITVQLARDGSAQCRIMDRGPGIAPQDQAKLFTRFLNLATAGGRPQYSSGLGLAIAKHDVAQMGGHLWYESREGGGSIFGLSLPTS